LVLLLLFFFFYYKTSDDPLKECHVLRDDYLECLHHRKEYLRNEVIKKQEIKNKTGDSGHNSHGSHGGGH